MMEVNEPFVEEEVETFTEIDILSSSRQSSLLQSLPSPTTRERYDPSADPFESIAVRHSPTKKAKFEVG